MAGDSFNHSMELGGLAVLGAPSAIEAYHGHHGTHPTKGVAKWLTHSGKPVSELVGLGLLAAPTVRQMMSHGRGVAAKQADAPLQHLVWESAFRSLAGRLTE